jgi:hypothetical protein
MVDDTIVMLSPAQFSELINVIQTTRDDGPKPEVRRAQRVAHPCRMSITLGNNMDAGPAVLVQLKDISARGMCFLHHEPMAPGTVFVVRLESGTGESVTILCSMVHCRAIDKTTYQIGAEFTCVLSDQAPMTQEETAEDLMRIRSSILR